MKGKLQIKPIEAILTRDTRFFFDMSPYCILTIQNNISTTSISKNSGKHPKWYKDIIQIDKVFNSFVLKIQVYDQQSRGDQLIGSSIINIQQISKQVKKTLNKQIKLVYQSKDVGIFRMQLSWCRDMRQNSRFTQSMNSPKALQQNVVNKIPSEQCIINKKYTLQQMDNILFNDD